MNCNRERRGREGREGREGRKGVQDDVAGLTPGWTGEGAYPYRAGSPFGGFGCAAGEKQVLHCVQNDKLFGDAEAGEIWGRRPMLESQRERRGREGRKGVQDDAAGLAPGWTGEGACPYTGTDRPYTGRLGISLTGAD